MKRETYNKWFSIFILAGMAIAVVLITIFKLSDPGVNHLLLLVSAFGSIMGVLSSVMSASGRLLTFLFGLIDVIIYGAMCFVNWNNGGAGLGNGILHFVYFVPMQFIGFFQWKKHGASMTEKVKPRALGPRQRLLYSAVFAAGSIALYLILFRFDKSAATEFIRIAVVLDVLTIMCNIFGQILMSTAYIEQWVLWIGVNVFSLFIWTEAIFSGESDFALIYVIKYCFYLANSVHGLRNWIRLSGRLDIQ